MAVVAETLVAQAENVQKAVVLLCEQAAAGDVAAAKRVDPLARSGVGQAAGACAAHDAVDARGAGGMDEGELEELVATGSERRSRTLRVVPDAPDWRVRGTLPETNVVENT
jgi:hypothetical protein